jgi:hypothetical protein
MKKQDSQRAVAVPGARADGGTVSLRAIVTALVIASGACGATAQRGSASSSPEPVVVSSAWELPFALCRAYGAAGTPCYPTTADRAGRAVPPCRDAHRGRCEIRSGKGVCLLLPVPDGSSCTVGSGRGQCREGGCQVSEPGSGPPGAL